MKKNMKKVLMLGVLGMFMLAFAMSFVVAEAAPVTGNAFLDPIADMFAKWGDGQTSVNVAKYLFLALLSIIIYSIVGVLPFLSDQSNWIKWPFSIIVGFLATAFVTPAEVYMMLLSYSAMGVVISGVIPLVILVFFTIEVEKKDDRAGAMITPVVWIAFIAFLIYKVIAGWASDTNYLGATEALIYLGVMVASILFVIYKNKILNMIFERGMKAGMHKKESAQKITLSARITEKERLLSELVSSGKGARSHAYLTLKGEIEGLQAHLNSMP